MSGLQRALRAAARPMALASRRSVGAARLHSLSAAQRAVSAAAKASPSKWQSVLTATRALLTARPVSTPFATAVRRGFATDAAAGDAKADAQATTSAGNASGAAEWEKKLAERDKLLAERDKQIAELKADAEKKAKDAKDELLRAYAEMQNVRRIAKADVASANRYALQSLGKRLVDVLDTLQRAVTAVPQLSDAEGNAQPLADPATAELLLRSMHEGVALTEKLFLKGLAEHGFTRMDSHGQKVDPNRHNVLFQVDDHSKPPGTIVEVAKEGYMLHDRVIRPADVGVVKAPAKPKAA